MAKNIRRMFAMVMVICMLVSALPMQALAAEEEELPFTETDTITGGDLVVTITPSTDNGPSAVEITGTNDSGSSVVMSGTTSSESTTLSGTETTSGGTEIKVEYTESSTTGTNEAGDDVTVTSGSETKDYIGDSPIDVPPVEGLPTVEFKEGETNVNISTPLDTPATSVSGDLPEDENDNTYDYTKVTVDTADRTVTGSLTTGESVVIDPYQSNLECPVAPEDYEGKEYYDGSAGKDICIGDGTCNTKCIHYREGLTSKEEQNKDSLNDWGYVDGKPEDDSEANEPGYDSGYDMVWTGYGDGTKQAAAVVVEELVYLTDENGEIIYENGFPVVDMEKSTFVTGGNGKATEGMVLSVSQFALKHENGNYFYAYCMDASTGASPDTNKWYHISNLEDAIASDENTDGYLTEDEAGKIRAIANTGYWGTESGTGSVESLKALLSSTYAEDTVINVRYPGSNEAHPYTLSELIDGLTESEALAATQAAIWTIANSGDVDYNQKGNGGWVYDASVIGVLSAASTHNGKVVSSFLNEFKPEKDGESDARLQALYQALLSLEPIYEDGATQEKNNVIPSKEVINDVTVAISDKVAGNTYNADEDTDNDVYHASVNFTLAFVPDKDSDDLLVGLVTGYEKDENGNMVPVYAKDANGDPIIRRLAGKNSDGQTYGAIEADENGVYTLTGLQLGENANHTFDIRLEGTQYLDNGVYIYQAFDPEAGDTTRAASQTLVGMAQGTQHVTVTNTLTFNFNVDEKNHVVVEKFWSEETVEVVPPPETPEIPEEPVTYNFEYEEEEPQVFRLTNNDGLEEIPEEPVPLAAPVITGDNSALWMVVVLMAMVGMVAINLNDKKRQYETF